MSTSFRYAGLRMVQEEWGEGDEDFALYAHVLVQPADASPCEAFVVKIVSPTYLAWLLQDDQEEMLWGHGFLLVGHYDAEVVDDALRGLVERDDLDDWCSCSRFIPRFAHVL